jgi:hypothetical protein
MRQIRGLTLRLVRSGKYRVNFRDGPGAACRQISDMSGRCHIRKPIAEPAPPTAQVSANGSSKQSHGGNLVRSLLGRGTALRGIPGFNLRWKITRANTGENRKNGSKITTISSTNADSIRVF